MKPVSHSMTREQFEEIARDGSAGDAIKHLLAAERSKHMLLIRAIYDAAAARGRVTAAYNLLARVDRVAPLAAEAVICYPAVGACALYLSRGRPSDHARDRAGWLASVAAAAAIRGRVTFSIEVPVQRGDASVVLPSLGRAEFSDAGHASAAVVRSTAEGAQISCGTARVHVPSDPHADAPGWRALRVVSAFSDGMRLRAILDDQNPCRLPSRAANDARFDDVGHELWERVIAGGWQILTRNHPEVAADVTAAIRVLTPLTAPAGSELSATAREAFGSIALSMPSSELSMAVTFAHEVQHAKLAALMDMYPLLESSGEAWYYAPWRQDPRPLAGLLQGAYAYLGVTDFWRRQRICETDPVQAMRAHTEFARWREATKDVTEFLLQSGYLLPHGRFLVNVMLRSLRQWCQEPVHPEARSAARQMAAKHRAEWLRHHGGAG